MHPMDVETQSTKYRGKLYTLSEENSWEDAGVGYASVEDFETEGGPARKLIFRDEETHKILHDRPVLGKDAYQLQGEADAKTIIVWEDAEVKKDWAVSFQNYLCAKDIWEALQGKPLPGNKLPVPKFGNLQEICRLLTCVPPSQREAMAMACMAPAFLAGLRDAFHTAEDLGSEEALTAVWQIISSILLLSNQALTERYLKQDVYEDVFGMLEYDVGLPLDKRIAHRQVLKGKVQFRSVGAFEDADMLERIHLNYRLQYLKDCVLPRLLDDAGFVSLTQLIHGNLSIILDHLQKSTQLLERVFVHIRRSDAQSLMFLQDACRHARQVPPAARQALYEKMTECKLFETLAPLLKAEGRADGLPHAHHAAIEVLCLSTSNDASQLRRFLVNGHAEGQDFLTTLIKLMLTEEDQGVQGQIADTLKTIMDITTLEQRDRDRWLEVLYDRGPLEELVAPLTADRGRASGASALFGQQLLCEIMAFAVAHHGYRAKTFIVRHGFAQQTMRLVGAPMRFVQLAPLRLLRALVGTKDDGCHRYITKSRLFVPVMRSFQQSVVPPALGSNMMVSAVLELLEFIRTENIKVLVDHICKRHGPLLQEHASRFGSLRALLLRHQQNLEYEAFPPERHSAGGPMNRPSNSVQGPPNRTRSPGRDDSDEDEEAYFESLDEDEEAEGANSHNAPSCAAAVGSGCAVPGVASASARTAGAVDSSQAPNAGVTESSSLASVKGLEGLLGHYQDEDVAKRESATRGGLDGQKGGNRKRSVDLHGKEKVDGAECGDAPVVNTSHPTVEAAANIATADGRTSVADACGAADGVDVKACTTAAGALKRQGQADELSKAGPAREELPRPGNGPGDVSTEDLRSAGGHLLREESGGGSVASGPGAEATGPGPGLPEDPAVVDSKVLTEKSLNHVSKRLKTSPASAAV